jgi:hypothetical protein
VTCRKRELRAAEYRSFAAGARAMVQTSTLENVRAKHSQAATVWETLAALDEQPSLPVNVRS